jgi:hypothetical protein
MGSVHACADTGLSGGMATTSAVGVVGVVVEEVRYGARRTQMRGPGADNYLLHQRMRLDLSLTARSTCISPNGSPFMRPKSFNRWKQGETPLSEQAIAEVARALPLLPDGTPSRSIASLPLVRRTLPVTKPRRLGGLLTHGPGRARHMSRPSQAAPNSHRRPVRQCLGGDYAHTVDDAEPSSGGCA